MIRIGIAGYGNLGRGAEAALAQNADMVLAGIFSRRGRDAVHPASAGTPVWPLGDAAAHAGEVDVLLLCLGSARDLPCHAPALARAFHTVDSFDTHAAIPDHCAAMDAAAAESGHVALVACGWDPGLFSLMRIYADALLPAGHSDTFWGRGVSQGHSEALRRVCGVTDARQYTVPLASAVEAARRGGGPLTARESHRRVCYVAAEEGADRAEISRTIQAMPHYFAGYGTSVHFVSPADLAAHHSGLAHGGLVLHSGATAGGERHTMELRLTLGSNPAFTGSTLVACARAVHRLALRGETGCRTMADLSPALLSPHTPEELRRTFL